MFLLVVNAIVSCIFINALCIHSVIVLRKPFVSDECFGLLNNFTDIFITQKKDVRNLNRTAELLNLGKLFNSSKIAVKNCKQKYNDQMFDEHQLPNNISVLKKRSKRFVNLRIWNFGWTRFHTLEEIYAWLDILPQMYPRIARTVVAGRSFEGRSIKGIHLKFSENKDAVFIEAGIHAREWLSHATATYLINELLTSNEPMVRWLAQSFDWYIFPCVNPDGYVFTHINPQNPNYRLWRKTRSPNTVKRCWSPNNCREITCYGVDLNRNWGYYWGGPGSGSDVCSEIFAGKQAFSEIESSTLANYIQTIGYKLFAYISFHTYIQNILFPFGHTSTHLGNYNEQLQVGIQAVNALSRRYGTKYKVGNVAELIGSAICGGSIDWVKASFNVPFVYGYELRGHTNYGQKYGFVAPPSEIIPNGQEVLDSLVALFRAASEYYPQLKRNAY